MLMGDLFPLVAQGLCEYGTAFYRPMPHNEWMEYDLVLQRWFVHPKYRNIEYIPLTEDQVRLSNSIFGSPGSAAQALADALSLPGTPRGVPAACTPSVFASAPGTPPSCLPRLGGLDSPASAQPGTPCHILPGTPHHQWAPPTPGLIAAPSSPHAAGIPPPGARAADQNVGQEAAAHARREEAASECCICLRPTEKLYICIPCGHTCLCEACAQDIEGSPCPLCRTPVDLVNIAHLSSRPVKRQRTD